MQGGCTDCFEGTKLFGIKCEFRIAICRGEVRIEYTNKYPKICACPCCKADIFGSEKAYRCSNKDCSLNYGPLFKKSFGIEFTRDDVARLFAGENIKKARKFKNGDIVLNHVAFNKAALSLRVVRPDYDDCE